MGCCFSSAVKERNSGKAQNQHHLAVNPRPSLEEETVKEVLSETPLPPPSERDPEIITPEPEEEKLALPKICAISCKPEEEDGPAREDASEYSEIYSASESLSTVTTNTTIAEKKDDDVTSRSRDGREFSRRVHRSSPVRAPGGRQNTSADRRRMISKSPAPRSGLTENRRPPPMRTQGAAARTARTKARQCAGGVCNGHDFGGGDYRRSRSPSRGRDGGTGRSPVRRVGSGGGVRSVNSAGSGAGNGKDAGEESGEKLAVAEESNGNVLEQENESLDNPLVSLECFIFL